MNIYLLNASARTNGYCAKAAALLSKEAQARGHEIYTERTVKLKVGFCRACDSCKETGVCVINDDMQAVYEKLTNADAIIVATPVQFNTVPASLKCVLDRCQLFYNNREVERKQKRAAIIAIGGARSYEQQFSGVLSSHEHFFKYLNAKQVGNVLLSGSDRYDGILPQSANEQILAAASALFD